MGFTFCWLCSWAAAHCSLWPLQLQCADVGHYGHRMHSIDGGTWRHGDTRISEYQVGSVTTV